ncbi:hypothetical protein OOK36_51330 [Streptomyces sp. NBC_00365]|uniref:hypothetical protein n=1 Tax=Streptomyces sp. NBC_00365 TaxID=2975726 RepID=UPI00225844DF|nr:hypothetical protein [Streptomyces sp. NBC_00365]MCX5096961.1 hypothetical protein [Streptomyces sp. NBC_00365]
MIVRSFDIDEEAAQFDPYTGRLTPLGAMASAAPGSFHGHFGSLAGVTVVLYRSAEGLRLRIGEHTDVLLAGNVIVRHERSGDTCTLTVADTAGGPPMVELSYPAPEDAVDDAFDPTPFVEKEDFDLGLFVAQVVADPRRKDTIYA